MVEIDGVVVDEVGFGRTLTIQAKTLRVCCNLWNKKHRHFILAKCS
jgi:hypothetical protein